MKRFDRQEWSVCIFLTAAGFVAGHVDLHRNDEHKCRIALAGQNYDRATAVKALEEKADAFLANWGRKSRSGDSGFTAL
ncbi:hypothetical protein J7E62_22705 [Variovorax paradoxus]|nr:hypothetical protein [Variovorax paradoxus]